MSDAPKRPPRQGSPRSAARLAAVQALYQVEMTGTNAAAVAAEFVKYHNGQEIDGDEFIKADEILFRDLVTGTAARQAELDGLIAAALPKEWPLERLEIVLRAILRAAGFELLGRIDVPARVVINEYVDVAHAFFAGKEPGMVNGILDKLAHQLRASELSDAGR